MKQKSLLCIIALFFTSVIYAQDIIITNEAQKIEAKIIEVSKTEIQYKEFDNSDGPIFVLGTKEINSIIYSNGKVVVYNQPTMPEQSTTESTIDIDSVEILFVSGQKKFAKIVEMKSEYIIYEEDGKFQHAMASDLNKVTLLRNGQVRLYNGNLKVASSSIVARETPEPIYISREGNTYYCNGRALRGEAYASFLNTNCRVAYEQYNSGHTVATLGWVLFGVGLGLDIGFSWWLPYAWIPALGCEIACIPTLIVGYVRMHGSVKTYNAECSKKPIGYWSINASQNGIGIAYNF